MRFLFVYQSFAVQARDLVTRLGVSDVRVIIVRDREDYPNSEELALIGNDCPPAAVCQVVRKYARNIKDLVDIQIDPKEFRENDQRLIEWIAPQNETQIAIKAPSIAFLDAQKEAKKLIFAHNALKHADNLERRRWPFVNRAAALFMKMANGEDVGPMREWLHLHKVEFAQNGKVSYECFMETKKNKVIEETERHVKEGDKTHNTDCARIYFDTMRLMNSNYVVVFYVGPHPDEKLHEALIDAIG